MTHVVTCDDSTVQKPELVAYARRGEARHRDAMALGQVEMTNVSWSAPATLDFERWVRQGRRLGTVGRGIGWWIGDWLHFGNRRYGEKYVQASKITGYDVQTLMNMVYVTSSVEPARRREELSWSHHAEVAALSPDEQDYWLSKATEARLSVRDLRLMLRTERKRDRDASAPEHGGQAPDAQMTCPECGHSFHPLT